MKKNFRVLLLLIIIFVLVIPAFGSEGQIKIARTGQTSCYDTNGNVIDCTGTGQDGDKQAGVEWPSPRFIDNDDGTVTDNLTGLIWLKNAHCFGEISWSQALNECNNLENGECGLNDGSVTGEWRLPNIIELTSLVNTEETNLDTWLISQGFTNVIPSGYWSDSNGAYRKYHAMNINMSYGKLDDRPKSSSQVDCVWPVRDGHSGPARPWKTGQTICHNVSGDVIDCTDTGQDGDIQAGVEWPSPRFIDNEDGTISDTLTELVWLTDANYFGVRTWSQALNDCNNLSSESIGLNDGSQSGDWRLPNRKELLSLIDYERSYPALQTGHPFTNLQTNYYWSSNTTYYPSYAWTLNPGDGTETTLPKINTYFVLPVRDNLGAPATIPTLSEYGIIIFSLILILAAIVSIRGRIFVE